MPAVVSIAVPLYIVTMASQNVPGVAVTTSFGYDVPWRETMTVTGIGTLVGAPFGGHAINLAAITAAMNAGPMAGPDREPTLDRHRRRRRRRTWSSRWRAAR